MSYCPSLSDLLKERAKIKINAKIIIADCEPVTELHIQPMQAALSTAFSMALHCKHEVSEQMLVYVFGILVMCLYFFGFFLLREGDRRWDL